MLETGAAHATGLVGAVGVGTVDRHVDVVVEAVVAGALTTQASAAGAARAAGEPLAVGVETVGPGVAVVVLHVAAARLALHACV
jgi:hypothetical protein